MMVTKNYALKSKPFQPNQLVFAISGLFLLCVAFTAQVKAETNATGINIEVLGDTTNSDNDAVQTFLGDIDSQDQTAINASQDDLWARIKDGYAMSEIKSEYTANHESWYASRPDYVKRMVQRSQKYLFHVVEEVQKRGMPTEIALLPMVESAFNPQAYSRSKASGIWQFVPGTGKDYGLKQTWWVDNRRDVTAATDAALNYLQKLHGMFGAWDLALAAYNAGEGTVQRAIERNRSRGLPTNYQNLDLPAETRNYVPKLQAIKNIVTNPEKYGLTINSIPNQPYFTQVKAPKQIDAKLAAQLAEISYDEFTALNPSYNRPVITASGEIHQFLLPTWAAERFTNNLENYNKPLSSWQTYHAKRGERMDNIAKKFGMNVGELRNVNSLSNHKKFSVSQPVLVPANFNYRDAANIDPQMNIDTSEPAQTEANDEDNEPSANLPVIHKVRRGETLQAVARKYDVDAKTLIAINHLKSSHLKAGQVIRLSKSGIKTKNHQILASYKGNKHGIKNKNNSKIKARKSNRSSIKARKHTRLRT